MKPIDLYFIKICVMKQDNGKNVKPHVSVMVHRLYSIIVCNLEYLCMYIYRSESCAPSPYHR